MPEPEPEGDLNATLERLLGTVTRRRWWILCVFSAVALGAVVVLSLLPNRYTSEATLLVVQQQVPERYVVPTTTTDVSEALQGMTQEVLSRTRLMAVIDEFGLYGKEKARLAPEQILNLMRRNIEIEPVEGTWGGRTNAGNVRTFKIAFTAETPDVAQQVANRLNSLFIAENLKTREDQATNTAKFLQAQLEDAKSKLADQEKRVRDFKMQHLGELPEQQTGNLAILAGLQTQLQNTAAALSRAQEQRVYLESLLRGYEDVSARSAAMPGGPAIAPVPGPVQDAQMELARLRAERSRLLGSYTPGHPDVVKAERDIERMEGLLKRLQAAQAPPSKTAAAPVQPPAVQDGAQDKMVAQVRSQLEANRVEFENLSRDHRNLRDAIEQYQNRINQTPVREAQLAGVLRDHDLLRQDYSELLKKKLEAELATSLERQQAGQQFRLVDPPSLPAVPTSPKRVKLSAAGAAAGLALGLALAFIVDKRNRSFYSEKMLRQRYGSVLVVGIPWLRTPGQERMRRWGKAAEYVGGTVLISAVFVAELYVYWHR
jgi:polysaccharide chain length determinant protein (PEP-CTERM system associated)